MKPFLKFSIKTSKKNMTKTCSQYTKKYLKKVLCMLQLVKKETQSLLLTF